MRLLLDEQQDPAVAQRLRREKFDVKAVAERPELRSLVDEELLELATSERRALVTEDVRDFAILHRQMIAAGRHHEGIIVTSRQRFPRTKGARRDLIAALRLLLHAHPGEDDLRDALVWLPSAR